MKKSLWHGMALKFNTVIMSEEEHSTDILVHGKEWHLKVHTIPQAVDSIQRMPLKFLMMTDCKVCSSIGSVKGKYSFLTSETYTVSPRYSLWNVPLLEHIPILPNSSI